MNVNRQEGFLEGSLTERAEEREREMGNRDQIVSRVAELTVYGLRITFYTPRRYV